MKIGYYIVNRMPMFCCCA